ncbi:MAG: shikimate kinase [Burkholderiales bacterium]|nr:shikimate kinase [Burkholderiales bacterium]
MPGCGKSTIGRQLARMRQLPFLDSDHEIERYLGCSIREFFDREGEAAFREIEERVIGETLADPQARVIATGGGSVLRPANRAAMKTQATVVYLHTQVDDLARRLSRDTARPLLQVADPRQRLRELYTLRDPLYREVAHIVVDTAHKSAAMLVNLISMQLDLSAGSREDAK